jgi:hypothetical protein
LKLFTDVKFCDEDDIEDISEEDNENVNDDINKSKSQDQNENDKDYNNRNSNINISNDIINRKENLDKYNDKDKNEKLISSSSLSPSVPTKKFQPKNNEILNNSTEKSLKEFKKPLKNYNKIKNNNEKIINKNIKNNPGAAINSYNNSDINFDEMVFSSNNNSNINILNKKSTTTKNLRNKTPTNNYKENYKENHLNTSGLNISGGFNELVTKSSTKNKNKNSLKDFKELVKTKDKSFNIDNEEEKLERNKFNKKKRFTRNHKIMESMNKSEEKRIPKRKADFSIFKTEINPNFIKNAPNMESNIYIY